MLAVRITNSSKVLLQAGELVCSLSYHLLDQKGATLRHASVLGCSRRSIPAKLLARSEDLRSNRPGKHRLEIDLVWEGVMVQGYGNPTAFVDLLVG